jgi:ribulose-phosphate 3-epimerase
VVKSIRRVTDLKLDVHLMIERPENHIEAFVEAGADLVSVHQETSPHLERTLRFIQSLGAKAGVVLNPGTSLATLDYVIEAADFVLLMTVNPGFGGQKFIPQMVSKIRELDRMRKDRDLELPIEIDGGVSSANIAELTRAGVDWFVAGSFVFDSPDPADTVKELTRLAAEATAIRV